MNLRYAPHRFDPGSQYRLHLFLLGDTEPMYLSVGMDIRQQRHPLQRSLRCQQQVPDQRPHFRAALIPQLLEQWGIARRLEVLFAKEQIVSVVVAVPQIWSVSK